MGAYHWELSFTGVRQVVPELVCGWCASITHKQRGACVISPGRAMIHEICSRRHLDCDEVSVLQMMIKSESRLNLPEVIIRLLVISAGASMAAHGVASSGGLRRLHSLMSCSSSDSSSSIV